MAFGRGGSQEANFAWVAYFIVGNVRKEASERVQLSMNRLRSTDVHLRRTGREDTGLFVANSFSGEKL